MNKKISNIIIISTFLYIGFMFGIVISVIICRANELKRLESQGTLIQSQSEWKRKTYAKKYNQVIVKHLFELKDQKEAE